MRGEKRASSLGLGPHPLPWYSVSDNYLLLLTKAFQSVSGSAIAYYIIIGGLKKLLIKDFV